MHGALNDDIILVLAGGDIVMDLIVGQEVMPAHRRHQQRNADLTQRARRGIVA